MSLRDFVIKQKLGQGSFAEVYKVSRLVDNNLYALKKISIHKLDQKLKQNALNEVRFLASFKCRNIIQYREAFFDDQLEQLCVIMEYADGGDLGKLIQKKKQKNELFYEVQIWKIVISLVNGIKYLHDRSILHRDLKPQNIFISNNQFKIADLNVSKYSQKDIQLKQTQIGTPYFASPQIWQNKPYDKKCDIWSFGVILYQLATLNLPFVSNSLDKLYDQITKGKNFTIPKHYSNQLLKIIRRCLQIDAHKRPTIEELSNNFTIKMYRNLTSVNSNDQDIKDIKYSLKEIMGEKGLNLSQIDFPTSNYKIEQKIIYEKMGKKQFGIAVDQREMNDKGDPIILEKQNEGKVFEERIKSCIKKKMGNPKQNRLEFRQGNLTLQRQKQGENQSIKQFLALLKLRQNRNAEKVSIYRKQKQKQIDGVNKQTQAPQFASQKLLVDQNPRVERKKSLPRTELSARKLKAISSGEQSGKQNERRFQKNFDKNKADSESKLDIGIKIIKKQENKKERNRIKQFLLNGINNFGKTDMIKQKLKKKLVSF